MLRQVILETGVIYSHTFINWRAIVEFYMIYLRKLLDIGFMRNGGGLRQRGACATIIGGGFWDTNSKFAVVCTKARYNEHFMGSYWTSTN